MAEFRGRVAWFSNAKGYGFLSRNNGPDIFVHFSSIAEEGYKSLREDEEVEFDIENAFRGAQAINVRRLGAPHPLVRMER